MQDGEGMNLYLFGKSYHKSKKKAVIGLICFFCGRTADVVITALPLNREAEAGGQTDALSPTKKNLRTPMLR
jgi:hypothetical protein